MKNKQTKQESRTTHNLFSVSRIMNNVDHPRWIILSRVIWIRWIILERKREKETYEDRQIGRRIYIYRERGGESEIDCISYISHHLLLIDYPLITRYRYMCCHNGYGPEGPAAP